MIRKKNFSDLIAALENKNKLMSLHRELKKLSPETYYLTLRCLSAEILTTFYVCNIRPPLEIIESTLKSFLAFPKNPLDKKKGIFLDYSTVFLLNTFGMNNVFDKKKISNFLKPPKTWYQFSDWAVDASALAIPGPIELKTTIRKETVHLARGSCLYMLHRDYQKTVKLLRWLPFCNLSSRSSKSMVELFSYLENIPIDDSELKFHLVITKKILKKMR